MNILSLCVCFSTVRLAEIKSDTVLTAPCETSVLYPTTGGNIHAFTAETSCAVLDILTPPYKDDPAYYRLYPYSSGLSPKGKLYWFLLPSFLRL